MNLMMDNIFNVYSWLSNASSHSVQLFLGTSSVQKQKLSGCIKKEFLSIVFIHRSKEKSTQKHFNPVGKSCALHSWVHSVVTDNFFFGAPVYVHFIVKKQQQNDMNMKCGRVEFSFQVFAFACLEFKIVSPSGLVESHQTRRIKLRKGTCSSIQIC